MGLNLANSKLIFFLNITHIMYWAGRIQRCVCKCDSGYN